jgi:hypothetical protein
VLSPFQVVEEDVVVGVRHIDFAFKNGRLTLLNAGLDVVGVLVY